MGDDAIVQQVLRDYRTAAVDHRLRVTLEFLQAMTVEPDRLTPDSVREVLRAGVSKEALRDAMEVAFLFNIYDRLADTLGWQVPPVESGYYKVSARRLLRRGYQ